jgi:hypothetical protein
MNQQLTAAGPHADNGGYGASASSPTPTPTPRSPSGSGRSILHLPHYHSNHQNQNHHHHQQHHHHQHHHHLLLPRRTTAPVTAVETDDAAPLGSSGPSDDNDGEGAIVAFVTGHPVEGDNNNNNNNNDDDGDVIPGPPSSLQQQQQQGRKRGKKQRNEASNSRSSTGGGSSSSAGMGGSRTAGGGGILARTFRRQASDQSKGSSGSDAAVDPYNKSGGSGASAGIGIGIGGAAGGGGGGGDELELSRTEHLQWSGGGILANREDLDMPEDQFAAGCNLLQAAARGDVPHMKELLASGRTKVNFRDYDRRTALHVAASEGHLDVCQFLVSSGARVNRSDRWGGSPLDDAHRHRHVPIIQYLRDLGAVTGSGNRSTNLITAAASGDVDEVRMLLHSVINASNSSSTDDKKKMKQPSSSSGGAGVVVDVNKGDYDKRTALHLAAGEGHVEIVRVLCLAGADVNAEDRWYRRPLDDAVAGNHFVRGASCGMVDRWAHLPSPHKKNQRFRADALCPPPPPVAYVSLFFWALVGIFFVSPLFFC